MKYDVLNAYRFFLLKEGRAPTTVQKYFNCMDNLLVGENPIKTIENMNMDRIIDKLSNIEYKQRFSQSKNALLYFLKFCEIELNHNQKEKLKELEENTHKKYRKQEEMDYKKIDGTIKHIKNKKLKMSFGVMLESGLRVHELSQIEKEDCKISDAIIELNFKGKGGNYEKVEIAKAENKILFDRLIELIKNTKENKKVFYSANYLQQHAKRLGFHCHDLRRIASHMEYQKSRSLEETKIKMRHSNKRTTKIYLNSKINFE